MIDEKYPETRQTPSAHMPEPSRVVLSVAEPADRESIYRMRHEVYAKELGQHAPNSAESLRDLLDDGNIYLVAKVAGCIAGFVSITPPSERGYSIDKYFDRAALQFARHGGLFEVRFLTAMRAYRRSELA